MKGHTNQSHSIHLLAMSTGNDLEKIVSSKTGVPGQIFNILYQNRRVLLHKTLEEQNNLPESNLYVTIGLKGGRGI